MTVHMEQPSNITGSSYKPGYVCQLLKSNYGLRHAGEIWGNVIHSKIINWGFEQTNKDQHLYHYRLGTKVINLILVVDDLDFASNDKNLMQWFKAQLDDSFKVKLLGEHKLFIGWEMSRMENDFTLIRKITSTNYWNYTTLLTAPQLISAYRTILTLHIYMKTKLNCITLIISDIDYWSGLFRISLCTLPDISFAVSVLARQLNAPTARHFILAKRVVIYISWKELNNLLPKYNGKW